LVLQLAKSWMVQGLNLGVGKIFFIYLGWASGPHKPPVQWVLGFFLGSKAAGLGVDHQPPYSGNIVNE